MRLKYFIKRFDYLRVYNSPFKPPRIKFYCGKVAIGTPYFFPRRWVKFNTQDRIDAAIQAVNSNMSKRTFSEWLKHYKGYLKPVRKNIGFDFVSLGWKTKYDYYRFEWNPLVSFVFFKWQIALMFIPDNDSQYWESWLYYTRETKGTTAERIAKCRKEAPQTWTTTESDGVRRTVNYYNKILKTKWL